MGTEDEGRRGFEVFGRVQGVGFRWSTTQRARSLDLAGTVRNRPDGAVEVHAAGDPGDLDALRSWLEQGPPAAVVEDVREIPAKEELPSRFQIVR